MQTSLKHLNGHSHLLANWYLHKDRYLWALATVIDTQGSAYRKAGAMMLMNELGQYQGLISGGCLEADILRKARQVWQQGQSKIIEYDTSDEDELAWQLGCGGKVTILLQEISANTAYQQLDKLHLALEKGKSCQYQLGFEANWLSNQCTFLEQVVTHNVCERQENSLNLILRPAIKLAVFGGGVDARPLVSLASQLGWEVILVEPRPAYGRKTDFKEAYRILKKPILEHEGKAWLAQLDAAVIMTHNLELDAQALGLMNEVAVRYLGMLGPDHRTQKVIAQAGICPSAINHRLANPIGLKLGGELPESVALSILAEIHASLNGQDGTSLSQYL